MYVALSLSLYIYIYIYMYIMYVCIYVYMYRCISISLSLYIYIYMWYYLSNATRLIRPPLFLCVLRRVEGHNNLPHSSPLLKNTCVRQVVLDK